MQVFVIGGGAGGFFAAIHHKLAHPNDCVVIIEKSSEVLSKVRISGGGRCNVTHACFDPRELASFYPRGSRELLGPFHRFSPTDTMAWFESRGVSLKVESDNRVFPVSDSSESIVDCLVGEAARLGVNVWTQCPLGSIEKHDRFRLALGNGAVHDADKVVLATGSSRVGHGFAKALGHTIQDPIPSLFTFKIVDKALQALSGLSVQNAIVHLEGVPKAGQTGPVLITHWGLSGPAIIKLSAWQARRLHESKYHIGLVVNCVGESDVSFERMMGSSKKVMGTSPIAAIPTRLWRYLVTKSGVLSSMTWKQLTPKQLSRLQSCLIHDRFEIVGKGVFKEEFVTCGGVSLNEVNFKTMESKRCDGLFFAGEILDIDGVTGGFNFQNAWTTGFLSSVNPCL